MLSGIAIGGLVGVEHEYRVLVNGIRVDFGRLIHQLRIPGARIDPSDPNAYRCDWGGTITADGPEAEVAIPPVPRSPGFTAAVGSWCSVAHDALASLLPRGHALSGYSTHISVSMPTPLAHRVAKSYAETFAPGLMLLMDRADSPGLLVRPRPGRLELCGDFVIGDALRAAVAFAVGSVVAIARGIAPERLPARTEPAVHRYGLFVARHAFGPDLYASGRRTRLATGETADERLARSWAIARAELGEVAAADLAAADRAVGGEASLPSEVTTTLASTSEPYRVRSAFDALRRPIVRPTFVARPVVATWDFVVYELRRAGRAMYANVPRDDLARFRARLSLGALDAAIESRSRRRWLRTTLGSASQTARFGWFDRLGDPQRLLAAERPSTVPRPSGLPSFLSIRPGKGRPDVPRVAGVPVNSIMSGSAGVVSGLLLASVIFCAPATPLVGGSEPAPTAVAGAPATPAPRAVGAYYQTYNTSATFARDDCGYSPGQATVTITGNADGSGATITVRLPRPPDWNPRTYTGSIKPDGSFTGTGSGAYEQNYPSNWTGSISGNVTNAGITATEDMTMAANSWCTKGQRKIVIQHAAS